MNWEGFLLNKDAYVKLLNTEDALVDATYYPASGSFIDTADFERCAFLIGAGALDTATTLAVYQDTSATATASIKALSGATVTIAATGDDKWYVIEFQTRKLDSDNGFRYVTLLCSGAAGGNDYGAIFFLGFGKGEVPVTQPTGTGGRGSAVAVVG